MEAAGSSPISNDNSELEVSSEGCRPSYGRSLKKSKTASQKKVITIPISNLDGARQKGEAPPPSDSWAWRKYGQKPIKGSPYPRGYYRCSSSKGCPARKQVERSRVDPTLLLVTYTSDHNHPFPAASRTPHAAGAANSSPEEIKKPELEPDVDVDVEKFELDGRLLLGHDAGWFFDIGDPAVLSETIEIDGAELGCYEIGSSSFGGGGGGGGEGEFGEEDDFFADLDELPDSSMVFRRGGVFEEEERHRCGLSTASIG